MKAIVMAGGEGTRLRPVTGGLPKPMVDILGKPVLERTVELLKKYGITDICFTLRYLPEMITEYFGDGERMGVHIENRIEKEPLGTAGGVKACADFIGKDDFLVISGDAVCDFDLGKCIEFHRQKGSEGTIVLYEHPEPIQYGTVMTAPDGKITGFIEKPEWSRVVTNRINTGIYIFSPSALEMIPEGQYDFGKELFPNMLREGRGLYGFCAKGYWCDIGSPEAYLGCCTDALSGKISISIDAPEVISGVQSVSDIPDSVKLYPPVFIGEGCNIAPDCSVGPYTVLAKDSEVGNGAAIARSVITGASIGRNADIKGAIIGRGTVIGENAEIKEGCVIGDKAVIGTGCTLSPGVKVWTSCRTKDGTLVERSIVKASPAKALRFSSGGVLRGEFPTEIDPETAMSFGRVFSGEKLAVAHSGGAAARIIAESLCCGAGSGETESFIIDSVYESELAEVCGIYGFSAAVFVRQEDSLITLSFFGRAGLPIDVGVQRKLITAQESEQKLCESCKAVGASTILGSMHAYLEKIRTVITNLAGAVKPINVTVKGKGAENRMLKLALESMGHTVAEAKGVPSFSAERGGFELTATDERGRKISAEKIKLLVVEAAFAAGAGAAAVPQDFPSAVDKIGDKYARRILRLSKDGKTAENLYISQPFMHDAAFAAALIAGVMSLREVSLAELADGLPRFATAQHRVDVACSRATAMRLLASSCAELANDFSFGLAVDGMNGRTRVNPAPDSPALIIRSEAETESEAQRLLGDMEKRIKEIGE